MISLCYEQLNADLIEEINDTRQKMVRVGTVYGLTHPLTITISQKLDDLLNDFHKQEGMEFVSLPQKNN